MFFLTRLILVFSFFYFSSCSKEPTSNSSTPTAIVSVSPYNTFVSSIAGDTVNVKVAVPANYNPHLFEPTPKHMENFQKASIWFGIGEPFEKNLLKTLQSQNPSLVVVDLSESLPADLYIEDAHGHSHNHHDHHSHHQEEIDRHFWMSPKLALIQSEMIAKKLCELFPENKQLYLQNLDSLKKEFHKIDTQLKKTLEPCKGQAIIVSHPSLGYFCHDYNIIQLSIECEGKTPLPADIKKILLYSKEHSILCVFTQEQFDNKGAIAMAKELKLPIYSINPNDPDYFKLLETLSNEIAHSKELIHEQP